MRLIYPVYKMHRDSTRELIFLFTKEEDAKAIVAERPNDLTKGQCLPLEVYDSMEDYLENGPDARRARALAKLTAAEKRLLGL